MTGRVVELVGVYHAHGTVRGELAGDVPATCDLSVRSAVADQFPTLG